MTASPADLWERVRESNRAWTGGRPEAVGELFHRDAVSTLAGTDHRVEGREAIVGSFVDYCNAARTLAFEETGHTVDLLGAAAVVTYAFSVRYAMDGTVHDERGREVLVFTEREGRWAVAWRMQVPGGAPGPGPESGREEP